MANYNKYKSNKDGKWYWEFKEYLGKDEESGKDIKVSRRRGKNGKPFSRKREAENEVVRLKLEFKENQNKKKELKDNITFEGMYKKWLKNRYNMTVKSSTLAKTERFFKSYILQEFGNISISKITIIQCDNAIQKWANSGLTEYKKIINYASRVFEYAVYTGYAHRNPIKSCYIPPQTAAQPNVKFIDKEDLLEFLEASKGYGEGTKWYTLFRTIAYTGCRKGEVLALEWSDIDWSHKEIAINKTLSKVDHADKPNEVVLNSSTKNGRSRVVSIDDGTLEVLKKFHEEQNGNSQIVFEAEKSDKYTHPDLINTAMDRIVSRTKISDKITPHMLRHTHASLLFEAGLSIKDVQHRLGHKDATTTINIYTHVSLDRKREAVDVFSKLLKE